MLSRLQGTGNARVGLATGLAGFSAIFLLLFLLTRHDSLRSPGRLNLARGFLNQIQGLSLYTAFELVNSREQMQLMLLLGEREVTCRYSSVEMSRSRCAPIQRWSDTFREALLLCRCNNVREQQNCSSKGWNGAQPALHQQYSCSSAPQLSCQSQPCLLLQVIFVS